MRTRHSECPAPELLAAYAEGLLEQPERGPVAEHVSRCEDCYSVVRVAVEFQAERAPATVLRGGARWLPQSISRWGLAAAAALLLAVGATTLLRNGPGVVTYAQAVSPLVDSVGPRRPFEPRLTGGFQFGPLDGVARTASPGVSTNSRVLAAAAQLKGRATGSADPAKLRALAAAELLTGNVERAEEQLQALAASQPGNADVLCDLAAARLVLYRSRGQAAALPSALDALDRAVAIVRAHPESSFNRALALQWLGRRAEAAEEWRRAAELAGEQGWRDEALAALREIEGTLPHR